MAKIVKQLQRDLKANPKKAGMLALLCLVCAWFWGPLVFPKDESKSKTTKSLATAPTTPSIVAGSSRAVLQSSLDWRQLAEKLDADERMSPAGTALPANDAERNPFAAPVEIAPSTSDVDALLAEAQGAGLLDDQAERPSPTDFAKALNEVPLALSTTLIGAGMRKAVINGRAYAVGASIGAVENVDIKLDRVEPRLAVVSWNGSTRELRIPRAGETPPPEAAEEKANETAGSVAEELNTSDDGGQLDLNEALELLEASGRL